MVNNVDFTVLKYSCLQYTYQSDPKDFFGLFLNFYNNISNKIHLLRANSMQACSNSLYKMVCVCLCMYSYACVLQRLSKKDESSWLNT